MSHSNVQSHLAEIDVNGKVVRISNPRLADRDSLVWDRRSGRLLAVDFNGTAPRVAVVDRLFNNPTSKRLANPPKHQLLIDVTVSHESGRMYSIQGKTNELVKVNTLTSRYQTIGRFNSSPRLVGITTAPLNDLP